MPTPFPTQKYRPYFTYAELQELVSALKTSPTHKRLHLAKYLEGFLIQIEHGLRKPNHTAEPTFTDRLELEDQPVHVPLTLTGEAAYQKWLANPTRATAHEIQIAQEFRYLNDLMSREEEVEYETSNGVRTS